METEWDARFLPDDETGGDEDCGTAAVEAGRVCLDDDGDDEDPVCDQSFSGICNVLVAISVGGQRQNQPHVRTFQLRN